ncbi:reverse transcriptase domain-containing protein [Tanacetum coccineum]
MGKGGSQVPSGLFHEAWGSNSKYLSACPHNGFTNWHQHDALFYNALYRKLPEDSLNLLRWQSLERPGLKRCLLTIIENYQATPPPASVKAVEEICVTCGGAHPYYQCLAAGSATLSWNYLDNFQGFVRVTAAAPIQQNQSVPLSELQKIKKMNDVNIKAMQAQINNVKNELRNEMQSSIQASMSNQTNELKNMMASFFQMNTASTSGMGSLPRTTVANPKGELKAITTRSGLILDGPTVPRPPPFINPEEDERVEETLTDPEYGEFTIKVPPPLVQKAKPLSQRNYMIHQKDPHHPHIPYPSRMNQEKQKEKDEMLKSLLSNKEKLIELANTPLNENCSAVILKKLLDKLGDPGKFLIPCGFSELKCKALADLGASINLMPLSVWKKLGLPELISTQMTLELANRDICTPKGIARDVFVLVGKFTFPADFIIVDYESNPRVPLILGRPFLRTARALIDIHGEEMILHDGNERLTLNMRHDTSSYSNEPHQESINMIDIYNASCKGYLEDLFSTIRQSGSPTFSHPDLTSPEVIDPESGNPTSSSLTSHTDLTSPKVNDDIFDPEEDIIENLLNLDKTKDLPPYHDNPLSGNPTPISEPKTKSSSSPTLTSIEESDLIWEEFKAYLVSDSFPPGNSNPSSPLSPFHNSLSGSTTSFLPSLPISETSDYFLEEFADELAHITFPPGNDDLPFDAESDLRELEYLLNHDPIKEMDSILEDSVDKNSSNDNLDDTISEMFTNEHALDYSSHHYGMIMMMNFLILRPEFLPFPECDSLFYEDFSEVDALSSTNNEDKVFNPGILIHENLFEVTNCATLEKNVKKTANASLILEDFNPPLYELPFHKEVPGLGALLSFSFENEEKVFNPGILTSKRVHSSLLPELSHWDSKAFKVIKIFESPMEIFLCYYEEDIRILDVPCLHFYPP